MNTRCIKNQSNEFISIYFEKHGGKVMAKDKDASKNKESFFQGVKSEMEKTSWPTKEELFKYTVIVVATVIFFMVFFWVLDVGIGNLIQLFR
jgi:preprotein translocase subunit SecE